MIEHSPILCEHLNEDSSRLKPQAIFDKMIVGTTSLGVMIYDESLIIDHFVELGKKYGLSNSSAREFALDYYYHNIESLTLQEGCVAPVFLSRREER